MELMKVIHYSLLNIKYSIISVACYPTVEKHHCAFGGMLLTADAFPEIEAADLVTHHDQEEVGEGGDHKMGDGDGSGTYCELHTWDVNKDKCDRKFSQERQVRPLIINAVICKTEVTSPADQVVGHLHNNRGDKIGCLCVQQGF